MAADPSSFGLLLRRHRLALGLTQEELAERAGVSPRSISEIERGAPHRPRKDTVALLADALDLPEQERAVFVAAARPLAPSSAPLPSVAPLSPVSAALPAALTPLVGREQESAVLTQLLGRGE